MSNLKTGDKVVVKDFISGKYSKSGTYFNFSMPEYIGKTMTVNQVNVTDRGDVYLAEDRGSWLWSPEWLEPVKSHFLTPTFMTSLKEKFVLSLTPEPQKTFRKLGLTNGDNLLTDEGKAIYESWRFQKDQQAFYDEVAKAMLAEKEAEAK